MLEIFIFLQKYVNLEHKTQHAVITHANTSYGIKIRTFFGKSWGMMLNLSNAPLKFCSKTVFTNCYNIGMLKFIDDILGWLKQELSAHRFFLSDWVSIKVLRGDSVSRV